MRSTRRAANFQKARRGTRDALFGGVMSAVGNLHLVTGPPAAPEPPVGTHASSRAQWAVGGLIAAAVIALIVAHGGSEERALRNLPPVERAALFHRTMDTLTGVCAREGRQQLRDLCRAQAQLALLFPECDGTCQAIAREQLRTPTR
jgi:hypothetical protein